MTCLEQQFSFRILRSRRITIICFDLYEELGMKNLSRNWVLSGKRLTAFRFLSQENLQRIKRLLLNQERREERWMFSLLVNKLNNRTRSRKLILSMLLRLDWGGSRESWLFYVHSSFNIDMRNRTIPNRTPILLVIILWPIWSSRKWKPAELLMNALWEWALCYRGVLITVV